ncbi:MAG: hypothetical protein WCC06_13240 [Candidatus Aminicenantales bacterium]
MVIRHLKHLVLGLFSLALASSLTARQAQAPAALSLKELIEKNIQFSGGREKIAQIQNFSFRTGPAAYTCTPRGQLKIVIGREPVITEVILVNPDQVQRNYFHETSEILGLQGAILQAQARLYSGLFTLLQFENDLQYSGLKTFGPEKFHHLETKIGELNIGFYLLPDNFALKRAVFQSVSSEGNKLEINCDFGPFEEIEGFKMPLSWFSSQVGTRGILYEVTGLKFNQPLEEDFFTKLEVQVGEVETGPGLLKGNVLAFNTQRNILSISTNWRKSDAERAGLKTHDALVLSIEGTETELVFYASPNELPSQSEMAGGAQMMYFNPRGLETYVITFFATDFSPISEKLKSLGPIQVKKK